MEFKLFNIESVGKKQEQLKGIGSSDRGFHWVREPYRTAVGNEVETCQEGQVFALALMRRQSINRLLEAWL